MKKLFFSSMACVCFAFYCLGQNTPPVKVRALKNNTNLRAKAALAAEVVGQVAANQELTARSMDADWVEVVAPTNVDFWVLGDYMKDGVVVCSQNVNVRAGPGINFNVVGRLTNGTSVEVRGSHAEWIKISPPETCSLWISRSLVEIVTVTPSVASPVQPKVVSTTPVSARPVGHAEAVQPAPRENDAPIIGKDVPATNVPSAGSNPEIQARAGKAASATNPPPDLDLIPEIGQGQVKRFEGTLKSRNFLVRSPAGYRLVVYDEGGHSQTICFVKGNRSQLEALLYRDLIIIGRQYWVHRHRQPVLVPEKIIIK